MVPNFTYSERFHIFTDKSNDRLLQLQRMYKNMVIMAYGVLACVAIIEMSFDLKNLEMQSENHG